MAAEGRVTYCRICEPLCGLVATVEDGRLVRLRPDDDHPLSRGFACPKGIAMTDIQNDPDISYVESDRRLRQLAGRRRTTAVPAETSGGLRGPRSLLASWGCLGW